MAGTESETKAFMAVCIETAKRYSLDDYRTPVFIFERLCSIIYPVSIGMAVASLIKLDFLNRYSCLHFGKKKYSVYNNDFILTSVEL